MQDTTLIALTILGGVFVIMVTALHKSGVEGALKMWNGMGALTGVAFGAIISFYFTSQLNDGEVQVLKNEVQIKEVALKSVVANARNIENSFASTISALSNDQPAKIRSLDGSLWEPNLSTTDRKNFELLFNSVKKDLSEIETLNQLSEKREFNQRASGQKMAN